MNETVQNGFSHVRIRAIEAWPSEHGKEATHLTLSAADQRELLQLAEVIQYSPSESQILSQGQSADFLYLLSDGIVEASHTLKGGDRQVVAFYWPGDLFGLAEEGLYVNSAKAITTCTVYRFPVRKLEQLLLENPEIQRGFFIKAVHDIRSAQRQLIVMGRLDIARRLAIFLLDCSGHEQYFDPGSQVLSIPMTRYDIADYLGTSAESVTRAMNALESKGFLRRVTARTVELKRAELKAFANVE